MPVKIFRIKNFIIETYIDGVLESVSYFYTKNDTMILWKRRNDIKGLTMRLRRLPHRYTDEYGINHESVSSCQRHYNIPDSQLVIYNDV